MKNIFQVMVLHIKNKHKSYLHHADWVGPEVMLVSLFHNCLEVILITNLLIETFVLRLSCSYMWPVKLIVWPGL